MKNESNPAVAARELGGLSAGVKRSFRASPRFRLIAAFITALVGFSIGAYVSQRQPTRSLGYVNRQSTPELLSIIAQQDTVTRRLHRWLAFKLPTGVKRFVPLGNPINPNYWKPGAANVLGDRTNESAIIVPVLIEQLNRLQPTNFLTGDYVAALARHGPVASNAIPWLERAALVPTNLLGWGSFGRGRSVSVSDIYDALVAINQDTDKVFNDITNRLTALGFPRNLFPTNTWFLVATLESQPAFKNQVWGMMDVLRRLPVPKDERVLFLQLLLDSPLPFVRETAWHTLAVIAPDLPKLREHALTRLVGPPSANTVYLDHLLAWAKEEPQLIEHLERTLQSVITQSGPEVYWMFCDRIVELGPSGHRFATSVVDHYFTNRVTTAFGDQRSDGWSAGYRFLPPFEKFIRSANVDCSKLLATLRSSAATETNRYRFDDAQVITQLSGDSGFELNFLEQRVTSAPTDIRKVKLGRYVQLVGDPAKASAFLEPFLSDPETTVRRHALREIGQLGDAATNLLAEIDLIAESDRSPAVRHIAKRTGNVLRGLPSDAGVFEVAVESQSPP